MVGAGLIYKRATRKMGSVMYRAVGVAVVTAFILVWMNLAVGLIGNESNPANLMYGGVLVVGVIGVIIVLSSFWNGARFVRDRTRSTFAPVVALLI